MEVRRPTSHDVAALAGVSRATVSHVLNGKGARFPQETQARVRAAAATLHYRPSPAGRALVNGRSDVVVLFMPYTTFGGNLQDLIDEVDRAAQTLGLTVVVRFASRDADAGLTVLADLAPTAVIDLAALSDADRRTLEQSGVAVLPDVPPGGRQDDRFDMEIGRTAAEELLAAGPRTLIYAALADPRSNPFGPYRYEGVARAARDHGLPAPAQVEVPLDADLATEALRAVLTEGLPVAVACYNDAVAIAVLAAARTLGAEVPDDVSVIGVDATEIGQLLNPRLTSLRIDLRSAVSRVIQDLHRLRGLPEPIQPAVDAPLISIVRGSTV